MMTSLILTKFGFKVETDNAVKCTIGIIYRHPKSNLSKFNSIIEPCTCNPSSQCNVLLSHYIVMFPLNTFPAPSFIYNKSTFTI